MIGFTVLAFVALQWQMADIHVSIVSNDPDNESNGSVTISVINTADTKLLFYKSDIAKGKIEYLDNDEWKEFCNVEYDYAANEKNDGEIEYKKDAIEELYGDIFATLAPGEEWKLSIPEEYYDRMQSGTYRIVMTYISEKKFLKYVKDTALTELDAKTDISAEISDISDISDEIMTDEEANELVSEISLRGEEEVLTSAADKIFGGENVKIPNAEKYIAAAKSEVFIKNFTYETAKTTKTKGELTESTANNKK